MDTVRIDKWLWAARFYKTRSLASRACELGRVQSNHQLVKPAREVRVGDQLQIKNDGGDFQVEVLALSDTRGPAPVAQTLYRESEESREARKKAAEERKAAGIAAPGEDRPTYIPDLNTERKMELITDALLKRGAAVLGLLPPGRMSSASPPAASDR